MKTPMKISQIVRLESAVSLTVLVQLWLIVLGILVKNFTMRSQGHGSQHAVLVKCVHLITVEDVARFALMRISQLDR